MANSFFNLLGNLEYYLLIQDKDKYFETYSLDINNINNIDDNDSYNVCNIITK
jgi:hypothetical protein